MNESPSGAPLLEVRGLTKTFKERRGWPIPTQPAVCSPMTVPMPFAWTPAAMISVLKMSCWIPM